MVCQQTLIRHLLCACLYTKFNDGEGQRRPGLFFLHNRTYKSTTRTTTARAGHGRHDRTTGLILWGL